VRGEDDARSKGNFQMNCRQRLSLAWRLGGVILVINKFENLRNSGASKGLLVSLFLLQQMQARSEFVISSILMMYTFMIINSDFTMSLQQIISFVSNIIPIFCVYSLPITNPGDLMLLKYLSLTISK
jgi:hypothetical protein